MLHGDGSLLFSSARELCPCFVSQVEQLIDIVDGALAKASQVAGQVG